MRTVVVTQPYVPAYRVPLFDAIDARLVDLGFKLEVVTGRPVGRQAQRGDQASGRWHRVFEAGLWQVGPRAVRAPRLPADLSNPAVVVTELEATNLLAWSRVSRGRVTVLWGHGKPYVTDPHAVPDRIEVALATRADAVMTYAPGGREWLIDRGVDAERVVAIGNATDSGAVASWRRGLPPGERQRRRASAGNGPSALFVGGLDASKRIEFLLEAFDAAHDWDPEFRATVVGAGSDRARVEEFVGRRPWCRYLPEARGQALGELALQADAIWMPGRVGLVAIDAMALDLPIFTTDFAHHAPEVEFLSPRDLLILDDHPVSFAKVALREMGAIRRAGFSEDRSADMPTIRSVSQNFVRVVLAAASL